MIDYFDGAPDFEEKIMAWYLCLYCDTKDSVSFHANRIYATEDCKECQGTDRDTIPWAELFVNGRPR